MKVRCYFVFLSLAILLLLPAAWAQSSLSTGSIQGTVTDPHDAVVPGANVTITNKATGQAIKATTSGSGTFSSGALQPATYEVRVEASGFQTVVSTVVVQIGVVSSDNVKLNVGKASEVVEVTGSSVAVNTEQATVQGVLNTEQIENLPFNGRNFLDLAQLEPGVQIQDGGNFDPTKNGFSSISFGGRFGRTARIEVDGIDISDETVGTTTQNIPASAIQEFQVSQSSLDLSTELTSSGAVNVLTHSGTNQWHGEAFYLFRDHSIAANISNTDVPFQRNNFGGNFGGYLIKDKLFFFLSGERQKQDLIETVVSAGPFAGVTGGFNSPFRDTQTMGRLDWQIKDSTRLFYRFTYEQNHTIKGFIPNSFQPFENANNTPMHLVGLDINGSSYNHSFRFGYMKFRNGIIDATTSGVFNPAPQISITIGNDPLCLTGNVDAFCSGSNLLAPQKTFQENIQGKYDGSKLLGTHTLRYGFGYNHIQGGGFAKFFALAPTVNSDPTAFDPGNAPFAGGAGNPLNYSTLFVLMGNGQGFSSEKPAFGLPGGGLGPDHRIQGYIGDSWKIKPNLTLVYGLRYVHDTGRTDSDIGPIPCSQLDPGFAANLAAAGTPCTGNILDLFGPHLGDRVRTPGKNFAPQFGFTWDPKKTGATVIRGGIGLYYENSIFNNNLFNRPGRLAQGLFLNEAVPCIPSVSGGVLIGIPNPGFSMPGGAPIPVNLSAVCGQPMGSVATQLAQLQAAYQAATLAVGPASNSAFIGNSLAASANINGINLFAPNYQTPRSVQMNIGFEHQLGKGIVWNADYIRNVATHSLLAIDVNHVGAARFFNKTAAQNAITATNAAFSCPDVNCAIGKGATIADYAANGLDSGTNLCGGLPQAGTGNCAAVPAFGGVNPQLGVNQMLFPAGRSVYNAFQTSLRANVSHPFTGLRYANLIFSYSLSRYLSSALDSDFINTAIDSDHPTGFLGPNGLDRTHQISFGGTFELPGSIRLSPIFHIDSPLPASLILPGAGAGGIFISDVTGDGSGDGSGIYPAGDLLPGSRIGAFGRDVNASNINSLLAAYNSGAVGKPTPAGQVLINNGLMTLAQLQALGGVMQPVALAPNGQVNLGWLRTVDFRLSYPKKLGERFSIEPSVSVFNAFNFANFDAPGNAINGNLVALGDTQTTGSVNSTTKATRNTRVLPGSGVFDLGAPRVFEFGLKLKF